MSTGCSTSDNASAVTAAPSFSPAGGVFSNSQAVTITDTTKGAVLYCTMDGSTPTTSSPQCGQPTTVFKSEFLQAIAVAPGLAASAIVSAGYTIDLAAAATPTFSPAGATFTSAQTVTIADTTAGANLYYTLDGSVPTASSTLYTGPIIISKTQTLSAIAVAAGFDDSGVASAIYTINPVAAMPVFTPAAGTYASPQTVTISDATAGATLYYTVDGSVPSVSSMLYSEPVIISASETLNAIAVAANFTNSPVASASYVINSPAAAPVFSVAAGSYNAVQTVTLSDTTLGAAIYYTTNGSAPTSGSTLYTGPITVSATETINAIAIASGYTSSPVASAAYTINLTGTSTPTFSLAAGAYTGTQTVMISDATANAVIYYTVNGSTPTSGSTLYTGPISVSATETLSAIAIAPGDSASAVATAAYTISLGNASLQGTVLSGTLPDKGAQVQLYAAGLTGYGSAATALLGAPVATDSTGAFSFPYSCPASPGDLVYVVAAGGDAGAGANAGLELMAALGPCSKLTGSTGIVVNEATTVVSAYALSAFITAAPNVGASSTNYIGLTNAFAAVNNLVNLTTGAALTITPAYAASPVEFLNSSTVPQSRIDTLANILNGCVNSNGGTCANLFSATTPTAGTAPANTLQAMIDIAQNPGTSVATLFGLASTTGPFQPVLAAVPGDLTLALTFTGAGLGIPPGTTATYSVGTGTSTYPTASGMPAFPTASSGLAIDATGNVWVVATVETTGPTQAASILAEFNNLGAPVTPSTTMNGSSITLGGYDPEPTSAGIRGLYDIAIDQGGTVWTDDFATNLLQVSSVTAAPTAPIANIVSDSGGGSAIAIDGGGNIWTGRIGINAGTSVLYEFQKTTSGVTPVLSAVNGQTGPSTTAYPGFSTMAFDSNSVLWDGVTRGAANGGSDVFQTDITTGDIAYDAFLPTSAGGGTNTNNYVTLVADGNGNVYGCADRDQNLANLNVFNTNAEGSSVPAIPISTGRGCGIQLVLDGQDHIFAVQDEFSNGSLQSGIDEFTTAGALLSPANGYTGTSTGEPVTINYGNEFGSQQGVSAAIDASGNLWVLNPETNGVDTNFNPLPGNILVEYIGLAAPVATPTSQAVTNSMNAVIGGLGSRP